MKRGQIEGLLMPALALILMFALTLVIVWFTVTSATHMASRLVNVTHPIIVFR